MRVRKFLSSFLLFLLLVAGVVFLVYKFVAPVLIKQAVEDKLKEELNKDVRLGKVDFDLFKGIEFHRLLIYKSGEGKILLQVGILRIDYKFDEVLDNFREKGRNFREWKLALKVTSPEVIVGRFRLENLQLPLRIDETGLAGENLRADTYGGILNCSFNMDLGADRKDYRLKGTLSRIDLNKLSKGLSSAKKKEIKGIIEANFDFKGTTDNLKSLDGRGKVSMVEGNLWNLPLLGGLMSILHIPSLGKVTFQEGNMNFNVSEGMITTEDLTLISDQVKLLARGRIDFQGYFRPSLTYKLYFPKSFLGEVPLIGKIISFVMDGTGNLITQVEVTGSLKEPKYRLVPLVKGIKDIFRMFTPSRGEQPRINP